MTTKIKYPVFNSFGFKVKAVIIRRYNRVIRRKYRRLSRLNLTKND